MRHAWSFTRRVFSELQKNHVGLLASAIAFDALMSIVPLLALLSVALSNVVEPRDVERLLSTQLEVLLPGAADRVVAAYSGIVKARTAAGLIGASTLLLFGTMAFRTIKSALGIIFSGLGRPRKKTSWRSALVPLAYVGISAFGLFAGTVAMTFLDALSHGQLNWFGVTIGLGLGGRALGRALCFVGLVLLLASFYRILPPTRPPLKVSLIGGLLAASVWELVRRLMVWYFAHLSLVGAYYGSLASAVVLLVGLDAAAMVLLSGAQVICELERSRRAGLPWYAEPHG